MTTPDLIAHEAPARARSRAKNIAIGTVIVALSLGFAILGAWLSSAPPGSEPRTPPTSWGVRP
jgi:flagellar basal body-associated protein FliL